MNLWINWRYRAVGLHLQYITEPVHLRDARINDVLHLPASEPLSVPLARRAAVWVVSMVNGGVVDESHYTLWRTLWDL